MILSVQFKEKTNETTKEWKQLLNKTCGLLESITTIESITETFLYMYI